MENSLTKIHVILSTTRQGRYSDKPGNWIMSVLKQREGIESELIDLREWQLPFYNDPVSPSNIKDGSYADPTVKRWAAKVAEADAYIVIAAEYNHGYPAVLKNAFDSIYAEWNGKPVGFVAYGSALGARSVEQLRQVVIELQMVPIRNSVHIPVDILMATREQAAPGDPALFASLNERANGLINQLLKMAQALKPARL